MKFYAEATFGKPERDAVLEVFDKGWLSGGEQTTAFEEKLAAWWGVKYAVAVNSGSSANFIAMQALDLPKDSEVITMAMGFPTTVSAIIYHGHTPVYVDCDIPSYTINTDSLEEAISSKTKALFFAHTLSNVADMDEIMEFVKKHEIKLIEDCCDAVGSTWAGRKVGTLGNMATVSFYPAHHMTTFGEGGAILTDDVLLYQKCKSIRDWGRSCICPRTRQKGCSARFSNPPFDHRYYYTNLGMNLKMNEASAAFGIQQIDRLEDFIQKRKDNFKALRDALGGIEDIILPETEQLAEPSWFAFPIIVKNHDKKMIMEALEAQGIQTRAIFAGNITRHPAYASSGRIVGDLRNSNRVLEHGFFVGVGPRLDETDMIEIANAIKNVMGGKKG